LVWRIHHSPRPDVSLSNRFLTPDEKFAVQTKLTKSSVLHDLPTYGGVFADPEIGPKKEGVMVFAA